ncbi:MAG TPA: hypothetical protein VGJ20_24695 [Xanthobacteraceae bacterium]
MARDEPAGPVEFVGPWDRLSAAKPIASAETPELMGFTMFSPSYALGKLDLHKIEESSRITRDWHVICYRHVEFLLFFDPFRAYIKEIHIDIKLAQPDQFFADRREEISRYGQNVFVALLYNDSFFVVIYQTDYLPLTAIRENERSIGIVTLQTTEACNPG